MHQLLRPRANARAETIVVVARGTTIDYNTRLANCDHEIFMREHHELKSTSERALQT